MNVLMRIRAAGEPLDVTHGSSGFYLVAGDGSRDLIGPYDSYAGAAADVELLPVGRFRGIVRGTPLLRLEEVVDV